MMDCAAMIFATIVDAELAYARLLIGDVQQGGGRLLSTMFFVSMESALLGLTVCRIVDIVGCAIAGAVIGLRGGIRNA